MSALGKKARGMPALQGDGKSPAKPGLLGKSNPNPAESNADLHKNYANPIVGIYVI
jgi:hypothetical protein